MGSAAKLDLNPRFTFLSPNRGHALAQGQLSEHVDHAIIALDGRAPIGGDLSIELLNAPDPGTMLRVELWVNDLDDYTCTYGFLVTSENGRVPYARGERSVVCIDPESRRPVKWSTEFRAAHAELLRDLPAYG